MKMIKNSRPGIRQKQTGVTLIELLVAGVISLIAASGMILAMSSTLGTGSQTIQMARLTQEMRTAMQIMSRELRRANYHATFMNCYGKVNCLTTLGLTSKVGVIGITDNGNSDCLWFWYDRPQICPTSSCTTAELIAAQTAVTAESVAAFRLAETDDGVGRLQMTTARTEAASCGANSDWVDITDPNIMDVDTFTVTNFDLKFPSIVNEKINSAGATQNVEKIGLVITAKLTTDASVPAWIQGNANATRTMDEFVAVRNNTTTAP
jgi:Tfp pilus assembly protein PilW